MFVANAVGMSAEGWILGKLKNVGQNNLYFTPSDFTHDHM